jgi:hypothetical protein
VFGEREGQITGAAFVFIECLQALFPDAAVGSVQALAAGGQGPFDQRHAMVCGVSDVQSLVCGVSWPSQTQAAQHHLTSGPDDEVTGVKAPVGKSPAVQVGQRCHDLTATSDRTAEARWW